MAGETVATTMAGSTPEEKYKVTEEFQAEGKLCLITGAAGNAGGHFALGMPAASGCDAVLADIPKYQNEMDEVVRDVKTAELPVKIAVEMIQEKDLIDREAFYESLEKKYGPFACILDVYGINTARTFPGSAEMIQKPVLAAEDMKPRYQIGPNMVFNDKTILVLGAGGLWGSHMAAGMAAAEADLILVDTADKEAAILELCELIGDSVQVQVEYVSAEMYNDRAALLKHILQNYGSPDAILDVRAINPAE